MCAGNLVIGLSCVVAARCHRWVVFYRGLMGGAVPVFFIFWAHSWYEMETHHSVIISCSALSRVVVIRGNSDVRFINIIVLEHSVGGNEVVVESYPRIQRVYRREGSSGRKYKFELWNKVLVLGIEKLANNIDRCCLSFQESSGPIFCFYFHLHWLVGWLVAWPAVSMLYVDGEDDDNR